VAAVTLLAEGVLDPSFAEIARRSRRSLTTLRKLFSSRQEVLEAARERLASGEAGGEDPLLVIERGLDVGWPRDPEELQQVQRAAEVAESTGSLALAGRLRARLSRRYWTNINSPAEAASLVDEARRAESLMLRARANDADLLYAVDALFDALRVANRNDEAVHLAPRLVELAESVGDHDTIWRTRVWVIHHFGWTEPDRAIAEAQQPMPDGSIATTLALEGAAIAWVWGRSADLRTMLDLIDPDEVLWIDQVQWHLVRGDVARARGTLLERINDIDPVLALLCELAVDRRESIVHLIDRLEAEREAEPAWKLNNAGKIGVPMVLQRARDHLATPDTRVSVPEHVVAAAKSALSEILELVRPDPTLAPAGKATADVRGGAKLDLEDAREIAEMCLELHALVAPLPDSYLTARPERT